MNLKRPVHVAKVNPAVFTGLEMNQIRLPKCPVVAVSRVAGRAYVNKRSGTLLVLILNFKYD